MSFDEETVVAQVRRLSLRELRVWVREGWVRPAQSARGPVFDNVDIARIRLLCDLRKDMSLPADALPVILPLLDRLHQTRRELKSLSEAVEKQPEEVRQTVVATFRNIHGDTQDRDG
ncbi:chaperone modulator CbpM [Roseobacter ponti]|uniref:MerR family transcriptional regulator n=1 Tax=Roseobacter ponti TaxID=1891787 RepID=A0A858SUJ5_9RHOB|nr:chaperone modulator CbpM [Roseobacter ponti]QJF52355.1 MerR family transcriptional regulator [Roseobacter ponti]